MKDKNITEFENLITRLLKIDTISWCKYALKKDLLHKKVEPAFFDEVVKKSLQCGKNEAMNIAKSLSSHDIYHTAKNLGIYLKIIEQQVGANYLSFATFTTPNKIVINCTPIQRAVNLLNSCPTNPLPNLSYDLLLKIIFAHELFHFLESKNRSTIYTKNVKIVLWQFLWLKCKSNLRVASEIAAFSFAQEYCELDFSIFVLDFVLCYSFSSDFAKKIFDNVVKTGD
ncbi:MAG: hypothetical protein LBU60_02470 [Clostridiales bacterium]|nr:hypothetical protein [Clostridiales bacterium]